jgi:hypothetical protein
MLFIVFVLSALGLGVFAQSSAWGQCGGTGWVGATTCVSGSVLDYLCCLPYAEFIQGTPVFTPIHTTRRYDHIHTGCCHGTQRIIVCPWIWFIYKWYNHHRYYNCYHFNHEHHKIFDLHKFIYQLCPFFHIYVPFQSRWKAPSVGMEQLECLRMQYR